ncbi:TrbM/KikA/MpfK family conjugal transfer protein [Xylophilus ampelinus]|uniref:TrbM protein n=1 Tax=Xylophilus ampelinus TaxID=54067 RepID=A0A318SH96_9BURK|nr:TrbM/KikA/MpfK family conjugal transfer protein [Xylophilus ampelinus]MCS4511836.1 TrbM/KikA/MpfK family conjugal transfer protein [Xylophilus ampelinus]PYE73358.1 TrbM protein [Xylophilus ampelinus]
MKKKQFALAALVVALGSTAGTASAQDVLTGDTRLACEAILCLSSGTRPSECTPSLSRYFNITKRKLSDTIRARANFLQLCPVANQTPHMQSLVSAISQGAGRCDAQSLNSTMRVWTGGDDGRTYISNQMPDFCAAYTGHAYTDFTNSGTLPRYVGTTERGGYWVEARDYDRALAEYNERIRREDEERRRQSWLN